MLMIRLQRAGKRNRSEFRIVLAEKESAVAKKFTEILGSYNPRTKDLKIKEDRLQYWIGQHVALSPTVHNLFVTQKLIQAPKVKAFSIPKKPAAAAEQPAASAETQAPTAESEPAPATVAETPEQPQEQQTT